MTDLRKAKAWWHAEACQMKRDGVAMKDIASKFGRTIGTVMRATRDVKAKHGARRNIGGASGFKMGACRRVAISFTDEQVSVINAFAAEEGCSFSFAVAKMVDRSISFDRKLTAAE